MYILVLIKLYYESLLSHMCFTKPNVSSLHRIHRGKRSETNNEQNKNI